MIDIKEGQHVRITLEGEVIDHSAALRYLSIANGAYVEYTDDTVIEILASPLPTEPGLYVPTANVDDLDGTLVYCLSEGWDEESDQSTGLRWTIYGHGQPVTPTEAEASAKRTLKDLGGLTRLKPVI